MGKKSKAKRNANLAWVLGILLAIVVIGGAVMLSSGGGVDVNISGDTNEPTGATSCDLAPSLSVSARDAQQQGTAVTTGVHYMVNDVYQGTSFSAFSLGDKVQLLLNASGWIDVTTDEMTLGCGANKATLDDSEAILLADQNDPTLVIKEDSTTLTDAAAGGAINASAIASGGSDTYRVFLTGKDKDSSGQLLYVVEIGSTQNVSSVKMTDVNNNQLEKADVPSFYTNTLGSPYRAAFIVPSIDSATEVEYKLTAAAKSGKTISGAVYNTAYVGQSFVEDDGTFVEWGVEQEDGDTQYESTFDYDFFITA